MNKINFTINLSWGTALLVILIVFKITGFIDWPWVFVLFPLWFGFACIVLMFIIVGIITIINNRK